MTIESSPNLPASLVMSMYPQEAGSSSQAQEYFAKMADSNDLWLRVAQRYNIKLEASKVKPREALTERIKEDVRVLDSLYSKAVRQDITNPFERFEAYRDYIKLEAERRLKQGPGESESTPSSEENRESQEAENNDNAEFLKDHGKARAYFRALKDAGQSVFPSMRDRLANLCGLAREYPHMFKAYYEEHPEHLMEDLAGIVSPAMWMPGQTMWMPGQKKKTVDMNESMKEPLEIINWSIKQVDLPELAKLSKEQPSKYQKHLYGLFHSLGGAFHQQLPEGAVKEKYKDLLNQVGPFLFEDFKKIT